MTLRRLFIQLNLLSDNMRLLMGSTEYDFNVFSSTNHKINSYRAVLLMFMYYNKGDTVNNKTMKPPVLLNLHLWVFNQLNLLYDIILLLMNSTDMILLFTVLQIIKFILTGHFFNVLYFNKGDTVYCATIKPPVLLNLLYELQRVFNQLNLLSDMMLLLMVFIENDFTALSSTYHKFHSNRTVLLMSIYYVTTEL